MRLTASNLSEHHLNKVIDNFDYSFSQEESPFTKEGNRYTLNVNMAGFKKENIKISTENNILSIKAVQGPRNVCASYVIPYGAKASTSRAQYEGGMLHLSFYKGELRNKIDIEIL